MQILVQYKEKENEAGLPPVKKRNKNYFWMITGFERILSKGQGRRSGGMCKGGMSAMVYVRTESISEVNKENLERHFKGIPGFTPICIKNGLGEYVKKDEIYSTYDILLDCYKNAL